MTAAAAICFAIAAVAEIAGIRLVVKEARRAQEALRRWRGPVSVELSGAMAAFHRRDVVTTSIQQEADDEVIAHLLGSQAHRWTAVALLSVGILVGALGNFLSLPW